MLCLYILDSALNSEKARRASVQCTDIIIESTIDPVDLARNYNSKDIISDIFYKRVKDKAIGERNDECLETVLDEKKDHVNYDVGIFTKFVNILKEGLHQNVLADKIIAKVCYMSYLVLSD